MDPGWGYAVVWRVIIIIIIEISYSKSSLGRWPTRRPPMEAHYAYRKKDTRNDENTKELLESNKYNMNIR